MRCGHGFHTGGTAGSTPSLLLLPLAELRDFSYLDRSAPQTVAITSSRSKERPSIGRVTKPGGAAERSGMVQIAGRSAIGRCTQSPFAKLWQVFSQSSFFARLLNWLAARWPSCENCACEARLNRSRRPTSANQVAQCGVCQSQRFRASASENLGQQPGGRSRKSDDAARCVRAPTTPAARDCQPLDRSRNLERCPPCCFHLTSCCV
jgi:hypothetical protein